MPPIKTHETSYKIRCFVQALRFEAGWTYAQIAENQRLGVSTVWDICHAPATPKKRKGRPLTIDTPKRRLLVATATQDAEHRQMSYRDIADICGIRAGDKALRKAFALEGYHRRKARKKPFLTDLQKQKRLRFALEHQHWTPEDWRRVIWTDECYVWLSGARGTVWITRCAGEEYEDACISPQFKQRNAIMIWGGILGGNKTPLVIWERDDWGTITALSYCTNVLTPVLWPFWQEQSARAGQPLWLMEDGASAHRARYTRALQAQYAMPILSWPPILPDLNPIENVWHSLKGILEARRPRIRGKQEMRTAVLEAWDQLDPNQILEYVDSMPDRIQAVLAANGGHTRW